MKRASLWLVLGAAGLAVASGGRLRAEVPELAEAGFAVRKTVQIAAPPRQVYDKLVKNLGEWWDSSHSFSHDAKNLSLEARRGGCFCERLGDEGFVRHQTVIFADPGKLLRLSGGLGPLQEYAITGVWTLSFAEKEGGTELVSTYRVSGHYPPGFASIAPGVDGVLGAQVERLKRYVETGKAEED